MVSHLKFVTKESMSHGSLCGLKGLNLGLVMNRDYSKGTASQHCRDFPPPTLSMELKNKDSS